MNILKRKYNYFQAKITYSLFQSFSFLYTYKNELKHLYITIKVFIINLAFSSSQHLFDNIKAILEATFSTHEVMDKDLLVNSLMVDVFYGHTVLNSLFD